MEVEAADDLIDGLSAKLAVSSSTHSSSGAFSFNLTAMVGKEEATFGRCARTISRLILTSSGASAFPLPIPGLFKEQISRCIEC